MQLIVSASQLMISSLLPCRCTLSIMWASTSSALPYYDFQAIPPSGQLLETRQLTQMTDCSSKVFIRREAWSELSMIPCHFPTIGEVMPLNNSTSGTAHIHQPNATASLSTPPSNDTGLTVPCSCPKNQLPPPKSDIPFTPTEGNREKLQVWLIDYYCSSTFNMYKSA